MGVTNGLQRGEGQLDGTRERKRIAKWRKMTFSWVGSNFSSSSSSSLSSYFSGQLPGGGRRRRGAEDGINQERRNTGRHKRSAKRRRESSFFISWKRAVFRPRTTTCCDKEGFSSSTLREGVFGEGFELQYPFWSASTRHCASRPGRFGVA